VRKGKRRCPDCDKVFNALMLTETEVKTNIADMQRERATKFYKHRRMMVFREEVDWLSPLANYFYFIVPADLKEKALNVCEERYPYAGLLVYNNGANDIYSPDNVSVVKRAKRFKRPKPDIQEILQIGYAASNTTIRYGHKLMA